MSDPTRPGCDQPQNQFAKQGDNYKINICLISQEKFFLLYYFFQFSQVESQMELLGIP